MSQLPSFLGLYTLLFNFFIFVQFLAKTASCMNPLVFAVSHPKFRQAMATELPCFGIGEKPKDTLETNAKDSA